ncbi:MAG: hypothetical protein EZS28_013212 [Streblomastix strix]|uniref:Protein kinase domain-containing protein n=1 Tax=Streblomastix strix TaxID=222440 RepID=A0A5J4W8N4_9EUKA|nr:MAG: hypothetical protein EZS28_013212 [Streblomastix strix]
MKENEQLSVRDALNFIEELAISINQLHSIGICHRDLTPENILIFPNMGVQLINYGNGSKYYAYFSDSRYTAPDIPQLVEVDTPFASDIWSMGIIITEVLIKKDPLTYSIV